MSSTAARILLVEDDARIRRELLDALRASGFVVDFSIDYNDASMSLQSDYDLILLDLGLPDGDGLDLCRSLRQRGREVPVIILTARDAPEQRVRGLDVGADDYVVKPFHMPELIARIRSVMRRSGRSVGPGRVQWRDLWADPDEHKAGRGETTFDLTPREFELLLFLLRFPDRTWTRDQLLNRVWGHDYEGDTRTVDLHIRRLRAKVEDEPSDPHYLNTVWGVGYRLSTEAGDA
ncbi:MAG: response regulator transcription factor [Planctomycetota bacterium]